MNRSIKRFGLLALLASLILAGCAVPPLPTVYWPVPPDQPRLQWLGTYYSADNFPKTGSQAFWENLLGKPELSLFGKPMGVAADGHGLVYVADMDTGKVKIFDFNTNKINYLGRGLSFRMPIGLALDRRGRLYVAEGGGSQVVVFGPEQKPLFAFGDTTTFQKPAYIALNERLGRIYVTDSKGHRVVVFDMEGKHLFSFGQVGEGDGEFFVPMGIAVDSKDRVYVAEMLNARIQVFDADGNFLNRFGERGDQVYELEGPRGLAIDSQDNIYVAEGRKSALMAFNPEGRALLFMGGASTTHPLGFTSPNGLWIDPNDRLYVTDSMNKNFMMWQYLTPAYLSEHPLDAGVLREVGDKVKRRPN